MSSAPSPPKPARHVVMPAAAALDLVLILVFAAVGRASHAEENPVLGALGTALPFLVGAAAGWALVHWRSGAWPLTFGTGIPVWFCTLAIGMLLRAVTGGGTGPPFVVIAAAVLAALLLGWRLLAQLVTRRWG